MLRRFDGTRSPDEVHDHIRATLATMRLAKLEDSAVIINARPPRRSRRWPPPAGSWRAATRCCARRRAPGVTTAELDEAAERFIRSQGAEPAFKGYRGFPGSICASPNSMVVHGIPGSYRLERGDILSIDIGVVLDGWVADAAITVPIGNVTPIATRLLRHHARRRCSTPSSSAVPGNRLGDVSHAVQARVEADGFA